MYDTDQVVARAIADKYLQHDGTRLTYDDLREDSQWLWRDIARAAIQALRERGQFNE